MAGGFAVPVPPVIGQNREGASRCSTPTIRADCPVVNFINVFTVKPGNQARLSENWQRSTVEVIRHLPGFSPDTVVSR